MNKRGKERKKRVEYVIQLIKENPEINKNILMFKIMAAFMIGQRYAKEYIDIAFYEIENRND